MQHNAAGSVPLASARRAFHSRLLETILKIGEKGLPTNSDTSNATSIALAKGIMDAIGQDAQGERLKGQVSGSKFEEICASFVKSTFAQLEPCRPGKWVVSKGIPGKGSNISVFDQYEHLARLNEIAKDNSELSAALGSDYLIKPDVIICREPEEDEFFNKDRQFVDGSVAKLTPIRKQNSNLLILHASISCKWTLRSDRAQNARSEALNLVRNRKGKLPHIVVITGEPMPSRIASLALGTGDIDCVYHVALPELVEAAEKLGKDDSIEMLKIMVDGKRLRDISDLPLDLVI